MSFKNRAVSLSVAVALAGGLFGGGVASAAPLAPATQADKPAATKQASVHGLQVEMGDPVIGEATLRWNKTNAAIWGWKLEADKPVLGKRGDQKSVQLHSQTFSQRLVLLKEGETINFTLTNNYTKQSETISYTQPVRRTSFNTQVALKGNEATVTWDVTGDTPKGMLIDVKDGNVAGHALVARTYNPDDNKVVLKGLPYGKVSEIKLFNPHTYKAEIKKVYVPALNKMPKATITVGVPVPAVIDRPGAHNDDFRTPKGETETISTMDLDVKPGYWVMTSYTTNPDAAFPNGERVVVQEGKIKN